MHRLWARRVGDATCVEHGSVDRRRWEAIEYTKWNNVISIHNAFVEFFIYGFKKHLVAQKPLLAASLNLSVRLVIGDGFKDKSLIS